MLRAYYRFILLGIAVELLFVLYFVRQFPLLQFYSGPYVDMGHITGHSHTAFWTFILVFAALFGLFGLAWRQVGAGSDGNLLWLILSFGALFAVTMTFVYPITANDIFSYVDQSLIMVQYHLNPISTPPASFPHDPLMRLSAGWAGFTAPYGPLGLVIDALPTLLVRRNLLANLILLKLMFSGMTLICAYSRSLLENQFYLYSFGSVVHNLLLNSISLDEATLLGRLLFIPVYGYALWLVARGRHELFRACFLVTFFFLALAITNVKPWYAVWPAVLAAALPQLPQRIAALLMACGAELAAALNIFVWVWESVTYDTLRPINNVSYVLIFVLPSVAVLIVFVWRHLPTEGRQRHPRLATHQSPD